MKINYLEQREYLNDEIDAFIKTTSMQEKTMSVTSKIITVTPSDARGYLSNMVHNRPLSNNNVKQYVGEIKSGRWGITGQGIIFDEKGRLLDGQHRMHAVVKSGISIQTLAIYGVASDAFALIDGGNKRTIADVINVKNRNVVAGAAKFVYREVNGLAWQGSIRPRAVDGVAIVKRFPELENSAEIASSLRKSVSNLPPSPIAYCHFRANMENSVACEIFFHGLKTGANLGERSPILALRKALTPAAGAYTNDVHAITMFIVAWKLYLNKSSVKNLKFPSETPNWSKALI